MWAQLFDVNMSNEYRPLGAIKCASSIPVMLDGCDTSFLLERSADYLQTVTQAKQAAPHPTLHGTQRRL